MSLYEEWPFLLIYFHFFTVYERNFQFFTKNVLSHTLSLSLALSLYPSLSFSLYLLHTRTHRHSLTLSLSISLGVTLSTAPNARYNTTVKKEALVRFMFNMAFENSIEDGYVTEKPFDALETGTFLFYFYFILCCTDRVWFILILILCWTGIILILIL